MAHSADRAYEAIEQTVAEAEKTNSSYKAYLEVVDQLTKVLGPIVEWEVSTPVVKEVFIPVLELQLGDSIGGRINQIFNPAGIPARASSLHQTALQAQRVGLPKTAEFFLKEQASYCREFIGSDSAAAKQAEAELRSLRTRR